VSLIQIGSGRAAPLISAGLAPQSVCANEFCGNADAIATIRNHDISSKERLQILLLQS
jgi:hypothetical protein